MRRKINPEEMKTPQLLEYAVVALAQLGGSSKKGPIIDRVGEMLKDILKPADIKLMHSRPDGKQDYAPPGCTDETWPVWAGKTSTALLYAKEYGWITRSEGGVYLNTRGHKAYSNACRMLVKSKIKSSRGLLAIVRLLWRTYSDL